MIFVPPMQYDPDDPELRCSDNLFETCETRAWWDFSEVTSISTPFSLNREC